MQSTCFVVAFLVCCQWTNVVWCDVKCLDNNGNPVDWFVLVKLPKLESSSVETIHDGVGQLYMDVNNQQWTLLKQGIDAQSQHAVYNTLQQIYSAKKSQDMAYLMYNDESPDGKTSYSYGHTKGDMCFDKSSGFWLVHSVPKFPPPAKDGYSYPDSGHTYGQTFLCVTYPYQQLNAIGLQLQYNYPQIYDFNLPASFSQDNVNLVQAVQHIHVKVAPWNHYAMLSSEAGQQFASFAKFSSYGKDLYDAWLAPSFKSNMKVETWQNGVGPLPSNCTAKYHVLNAASLNFMNNKFTNSHDHSKWAVADSQDWICIGDINRERSQKLRAGGTVCSLLPRVAKAFRAAIVSTKPCNGRHSDTKSPFIIL